MTKRGKRGTPRVAVLIPAAGSGRRMGRPGSKVLQILGGMTIIQHTVRIFQTHPRVERIGLIGRRADTNTLEALFPPGDARAKMGSFIRGGKERQDSVFNGMQALAADPPDWVLVHDGARPLCPPGLIDRVLAALERAPAAVPVLPVSDSLRRIAGKRSEPVERAGLHQVQTPQGFHWEALWRAHLAAREKGRHGTDEAELVEVEGFFLAFVEGAPENLKVTTESDLRFAESLLGF